MSNLFNSSETTSTATSQELFKQIRIRYASLEMPMPELLTHDAMCAYITSYKPPEWAVKSTMDGLSLDYIACMTIINTLHPQITAILSVDLMVRFNGLSNLRGCINNIRRERLVAGGVSPAVIDLQLRSDGSTNITSL